ncbi:hypothetical protein BH24ACT15_BH24ACT15_24980 [soil metagenome]
MQEPSLRHRRLGVVGPGLLVVAALGLRFVVSDDINHLVYGLVMGGCGLVGIVVWWQTRENDDLSQEWRRYAVMVSSGLLVGSTDAFVPAFGERRLGFIVAVVVGVPAVVVCLRRALQLRHATTADWLDAVLIACSFC